MSLSKGSQKVKSSKRKTKVETPEKSRKKKRLNFDPSDMMELIRDGTLKALSVESKKIEGERFVGLMNVVRENGVRSVRLVDVEVSGVDFAGVLSEMIAASESLRKVHIEKIPDLQDEGIAVIVASIVGNANIYDVSLIRSLFGMESASVLSEALLDTRSIQRLDLRYSDLDDAGLKRVFNSIVDNAAITHFGIGKSSSDIEKVANQINKLLVENSDLKYLSLEETRLNKKSVNFICEGLNDNNSIVGINLSATSLTEELLQTFFVTFSTHNTLVSINISNNSLSEDSTSSLIEFIQQKPELEELILENCDIDNSNLEKIVAALSESNIRVLNLCNNTFNHEVATAISTFIKESKTLEVLDVSQNDINHEGVVEICASLLENITLISLNLSNIFFTDIKKKARLDAFEALRDVFILNTTLECIYLNKIQTESTDMSAEYQLLVEGLIYNKGLNTFNLENSNIDEDLAISFFYMLLSNDKLKNFSIGDSSLPRNLRLSMQRYVAGTYTGCHNEIVTSPDGKIELQRLTDFFTQCLVTQQEYSHVFPKLDKRDKAIRKYLNGILTAFLTQGNSIYRKVVSIPDFSGNERTVGAAVWLPPESDIPPESQGGLPKQIWMKVTEKAAAGTKLKNLVYDFVQFVWKTSDDNCWTLIMADVLGSQPNLSIWQDLLRFGCDSATAAEKTTWAFITDPITKEVLRSFGFQVKKEGLLDNEVTMYAMYREPGPLEVVELDNEETSLRIKNSFFDSISEKPTLQKVKSKRK